MPNLVQLITQYYHETALEVKKCTWPPRGELMRSTVVVIVAVILLGIFVFVVDALCQGAVKLLLDIARG